MIESATIYVQQDNAFLNRGVRKLGIDEVLRFLGFMQEDIDIELQLATVATSKRIPVLMGVETAKSPVIWEMFIIITGCTPKLILVFAGIPRQDWPSPNDKLNIISTEFSANEFITIPMPNGISWIQELQKDPDTKKVIISLSNSYSSARDTFEDPCW